MLKKKSPKNKKKGSALVVTLFVLAIILISVLSITLVAVKERKASIGSSGSNRAYQSSDEGIEKVMQAITRGNYTTVGKMITGAGFSCSSGIITGTGYEVELLDIANAQIACIDSSTALVSTITRIKSIGTASGNKRATDALVSNKSTKNLLHLNEDPPVDSSYFSDKYTITNVGTVPFSDTIPTAVDNTKYGVFSAGKYLEVEATSDAVENWNFDDNDFTIDAWVKIGNPGPNKYTLVSRCEDNTKPGKCNFYFDITGHGLVSFNYSSGGSIKTISYTDSTITNDSWHHLVFERKGDKGYFFIDGSMNLSADTFGSGDVIAFDSTVAHELRVGINFKSESADSKSQFIGNMDELRITKGVARFPITDQNGSSVPGYFTPWDIEYAPND
ncbi:MAG: LamG-like jellyroll fold domain-containing protein [bacterium]|nr:LamG-like jellyroll fold domain-containing protein [bacterium]